MAEETESEYTRQNAAQRQCEPKQQSHVEHQVTTVGKRKLSDSSFKTLGNRPISHQPKSEV